MAYDLEEQEQLDEFKAWWKQHGQKVMTVVTGLVVVYLGYQSWNWYQNQQSLKASAQYENLVKLDISDTKNLKAIQSISGEIMDKFSGTPYAGRAALTAAKANFQANELKSAKTQLEWAADHAKEDAIRAMALLELAAMQVQEKDYASALKTLQVLMACSLICVVTFLLRKVKPLKLKLLIKKQSRSLIQKVTSLNLLNIS
jgi:predicted negative regulator of RcsB-dependent stress response